MDISTSYFVLVVLIFLAAFTNGQDLQPTAFIVTSPDDVNFTADTAVIVTFNLTVVNNGPGNVSDSGTDNFQVKILLSDNVQLENAIDSIEMDNTTTETNSTELSQAIDEDTSITLTGLTSTVTIPAKYCPLFNYLCVMLDVEGSIVNDTDLANNDKCIEFGPQGLAGESHCPESPTQTQIDSGVYVILSTFSISLWPSSVVQYRQDVANAVNGYCQSHGTECCLNKDIQDNTTNIIDAKHVFIGGYPQTTEDSLSVLTYVDVSGGNAFCSASSDFKLPQDVLHRAVQEGKENFTLRIGDVRVNEETPPSTDKSDLLLNRWQIAISVIIVFFGLVGMGTLICLAVPWNDPEPYMEEYKENVDKPTEKRGRVNLIPDPYEDIAGTVPGGSYDVDDTAPGGSYDVVDTDRYRQSDVVVATSSFNAASGPGVPTASEQRGFGDSEVNIHGGRTDRNSGVPETGMDTDSMIELQNIF